ncbi:MAG: glycosyltransferase [Kiritimatiellae bacterium]|nr:glycosyltransferase [Kiritimatiellia bacterium]
MPKVSVIIPVYNVEDYLRQCLDSVVNQTLRDIEVICVDDGSTDASPAILAEYAAKDPRVKVISQPNAGAGAARNRGLDVARGDYLFFFDPDDYAEPDMLGALVARADETGAEVVIAGRQVLDAAVGKIVEASLPSPRLASLGQPFAPLDAPTLAIDAGVMPWNKLFRRSFVSSQKIRFQEVRRANDLAFTCTALCAAARLVTAPVSGYVFRRSRKGSLQTTAGEDPTAFAAALLRFREELEARGLYAAHRRAYANLALAHCYYNLFGRPEVDAFTRLYAALRDRLFAALGLAETRLDDFDNKTHARYLKLTRENADPLPLLMQILKERHANWVALEQLKRTASLDREACARLESALSRADASARADEAYARFTAFELKSAQLREAPLGPGAHHAGGDEGHLRFLHERQLSLLKEVKAVCERHALRYYLIAGTLLGAVRHKGFIPWDDDVDIAMPRPDFERFGQYAAELPPDLSYQAPDARGYPLFIAMVRQNGTFADGLLRRFPVHHGIGIDIFPLDACPGGDKAAAGVFRRVEAFTSALLAKGDGSLELGPRAFPARLVFKALTHLPSAALKALRRREVRRAAARADGSRLCTLTGRHRYPAEAYPSAWFASSVPVEFEGEAFAAPVGWEPLLAHMYGDWRTPAKEGGR